MSIRMLIAGDLVPTESNAIYFEKADIEYLLGESLKRRLAAADFIVMNLEVPLTDIASPIRKCGPCLIAPTGTIEGIRRINPYFFTLANNHILDQGFQGLRSTTAMLEERGISYAGVGEDLEEANRPTIQDIGGQRVGFYCCAEHEFSIAGEKTPGANPFDPLESFDHVRKMRKACDYLIVLYHGGKEHYRYPSPMLRRVFRKFADAGADLVVAQHTHCIGCKEEHHGSTLVYGQGNFLFDYSNNEFWKTALILEVILPERKIRYLPIVKVGNRVREASMETGAEILRLFHQRSEEILEAGAIASKYDAFAKEMEAAYLRRFSGRIGNSLLVRVLCKMVSPGIIRWMYPKDVMVAIENMLDCEAHRELATRITKMEHR